MNKTQGYGLATVIFAAFCGAGIDLHSATFGLSGGIGAFLCFIAMATRAYNKTEGIDDGD